MGETAGPRTTRVFHMSLCVRGLIAQTSPAEWDRIASTGMILRRDGTRLTNGREALDAHLDAIRDGFEFVPIGEECDDFDPKSGCRGHEVPAEERP